MRNGTLPPSTPLALTAVLTLTLALGAAAPSGAVGEDWQARMVGLASDYGEETWKYSVDFEGQGSPALLVSHLQNRTTSYAGAVGLRAVVSVELVNQQAPDQALPANYNVTAFIDTTRGPVYALVARDAGNARLFHLNFDLDGANQVDPLGRVIPPVEPGVKDVVVVATKRVNDANPTVEVGRSNVQFRYVVPASRPALPDLAGSRYLQAVPDGSFRLFNDIGWDRSVLMVLRPVRDDTGLELVYEFEPQDAGATVELVALVAQRAVATPATNVPAPAPTLPGVSGVTTRDEAQNLIDNTERAVVIHRGVIGNAAVDASGLVTFNVNGQTLRSVQDGAPAGAIVVVAPVLATVFDAAACGADCTGGGQFSVGATELVVPVSPANVAVDAFELTDPALTTNQVPSNVPDPIREAALGANALEVFVRDLDGFAPNDVRAGDVHAIVPDARSSRALSSAGLVRSQREDNLLQGSLSVRGIQQERISHYRVLALVYQGQDVFHGVAWADRGYRVDAEPLVAVTPPGDGGVWVNFTSMTTNYDLQAGDPAFGINILYRLDIAAFDIDETRSIALKEGGRESVFVALNATTEGRELVRVNSTSGDTLPLGAETEAVWVAAKEKESLADKIPGPSAPVALAALAFALAFASRASRRRGNA